MLVRDKEDHRLQGEGRSDGCLDRANELNTFFNRFSPERSSASFYPTHSQTDPLLTHSFLVTPKMFYLPPQPWTLLLLHVCLQPNQKMLMMPLPPLPPVCLKKSGEETTGEIEPE
ncbi:hypothetical protein CHARACLAT_004977 [Characodon lateralis]|uniref:Uncharacterized protein n=1 Tax=Characodon lateralis TaxID=208331 RepID=A0ABU7F1L0_9TELE|nr:hypothetical protein [Characodon lateralis]